MLLRAAIVLLIALVIVLRNCRDMSSAYKKIVLLGDSQLEGSWDPQLEFCFPAALSQYFARRADVLNRGLSGYTSRWMQSQLTRTIAELDNNTAHLFILWLGTNDSTLWQPHHVPPALFEHTVRKYIAQIQTAFPAVKILLVTPGPISKTKARSSTMRTKGDDRTQAATKEYADLLIAVASSYDDDKVRVVDLFTAIVDAAGATDLELDANLKIGAFTLDGLHLAGNGYRVLFSLVKAAISDWPGARAEDLPRLEPDWQGAAKLYE